MRREVEAIRQETKVRRKRKRGRAGVDHLANNRQATQKIATTIRLLQTGMAVDGSPFDHGDIAGDIQDAGLVRIGQFGGDLGSHVAIRQPHVENREIRLMA